MRNVKLKAVVEDFEFLVGLEDNSVDKWTSFDRGLDFIDDFAGRDNKEITFAFDDYGDILKYDRSAEIVKAMRAKIQH